MRRSTGNYKTVIIGASSGGLEALERILSDLSEDLRLAIVVVQHLPKDAPIKGFVEVLQRVSKLPVAEAVWGHLPVPGKVYLAAPDYHLLIEKDGTFSLDSGERENYSRPSIDIFFESAADAIAPSTIGVILTGANEDGARGLKALREKGGYALIQDPSTAPAPQMPAAALKVAGADQVLSPEGIASFLNRQSMKQRGEDS